MSAPLKHSPLPLDRDAIRAALPEHAVIGREVRVFAETASTSDLARRAAEGGAEEGLVFFAERQTAGRGRRGRTWDSAPGLGLWFSIVLRPLVPRERWSRLALLCAAAVRRGLQSTLPELPVQWKWPNDLECGGRKFCGILIEASARYAIAGIGVNALHAAADFAPELRAQATSLALESAAPVERERVAGAILRALDELWQTDWGGANFNAICGELALHSSLLGQRVLLSAGSRTIEGVAEMLDSEGHLGLLLDDGSRLRVTSGDISRCRLKTAED